MTDAEERSGRSRSEDDVRKIYVDWRAAASGICSCESSESKSIIVPYSSFLFHISLTLLPSFQAVPDSRPATVNFAGFIPPFFSFNDPHFHLVMPDLIIDFVFFLDSNLQTFPPSGPLGKITAASGPPRDADGLWMSISSKIA